MNLSLDFHFFILFFMLQKNKRSPLIELIMDDVAKMDTVNVHGYSNQCENWSNSLSLLALKINDINTHEKKKGKNSNLKQSNENQLIIDSSLIWKSSNECATWREEQIATKSPSTPLDTHLTHWESTRLRFVEHLNLLFQTFLFRFVKQCLLQFWGVITYHLLIWYL